MIAVKRLRTGLSTYTAITHAIASGERGTVGAVPAVLRAVWLDVRIQSDLTRNDMAKYDAREIPPGL